MKGGVIMLGVADNETEDSASMIGEKKKKRRTLRKKSMKRGKKSKRNKRTRKH